MKVFAGTRLPWFPLPPEWRAFAAETPGSVLLETAGGLGSDHTSYLFRSPSKILRAATGPQFLALLDDVEAASQQGFYAAGSLDYEAAYALHTMDGPRARTVARLGIYREALRFNHHTGVASGPALAADSVNENMRAGPLLSLPRMQMGREAYGEKFAAVRDFLAAGDTYQVNLTTCVEAELLGSPLELYSALIDAQPVDFAAMQHFGDTLAFSFSPELFFRTKASRILTRPMKGTAPRGGSPEEDARQREWLAHDEKNRAEHVMIVDLLRNDLGRICESGSVSPDALFHVEPYPTLFQMTSSVSGVLRSGTRLRDIVGALFPSGSVTGAPKRRTMEIIRELENGPRGIYTGAIGFVAPGGDACFSVPIRTLDVRGSRVSMGVGGGVVADSTANGEYDECLLKASFLDRAATAPRLIETLLWDGGYSLIEQHMARLAGSAAELGFKCDIPAIRSALLDTAARFEGERRVRLLLSVDGSVAIEPGTVTGPRTGLRVRIAARRMLSSDPWLRHKTTRRAVYDREFARARLDGFDDVLFLNERGELTEGAISTLFIKLGDRFYTPPLASGALPGIYRQLRLQEPERFAEKVLHLEDLIAAEAAELTNAVRGSRPIGSLHIE